MLKTVLTAGFAMFSMFFGSGNLVFPLLLGIHTLDQSLFFAMPGFLITAVLVPFLGLLSIIAFDGNREKFFSTLGSHTGFILTFAILALIGPFGVMPRCLTVAFGGLQLVWPNLSFTLFSAVFCLLTGALIWRPNNVVGIIGVVLTPVKLGGIVLLILFGLAFAPLPTVGNLTLSAAFFQGFSLGYQTLDLMAGFFFSATIYQYLTTHLTEAKEAAGHQRRGRLIKASLMASMMGALLLTLIYVGFISLGASYAPYLGDASPEALLAAIAGLTMGPYALVIVSTTLAVSCLATAVILANLFSEFLRNDIAKKRMGLTLSNEMSVIITVGIGFAMAQMGFATICTILGTILTVAYPALIGLAIHHILQFWFSFNYSKIVFWGIFALSIGVNYFM